MSQSFPTPSLKPGLERIAHATDFSPQSLLAFQHALGLAVAARCHLDILHVHQSSAPKDWDAFPRVRQTLADWELLESTARIEEIEAHLGFKVAKIEIRNNDPVEGLSEFLVAHRPDMLVVATHGRDGLNRLLTGSVSQEVVRRARVPTLLIGPHARPFVDPDTGTVRLRSVLMPLDKRPLPTLALEAVCSRLQPVGLKVDAIDAITIGLEMPDLIAAGGHAVPVRELSGHVVDTILDVATEARSDLIVMVTTGRHGFLDGLRGSTTQRVVSAAPCPVLTLPLGESGP